MLRCFFWRTEAGIRPAQLGLSRAASGRHPRDPEDVAVQVPPCKRKRGEGDGSPEHGNANNPKDPVKLFYALGYAKYLRDVREFSESGDAWERWEKGGELAEPRDHTCDPARTHLQMGRQRLDVVTALIERRDFREMLAKDEIRSINIYSDVSPIIGNEVQGLVLDLMLRGGTMQRVVMPGATLAYSRADSLNKTAALLWSLWLLFGPDEPTMRKVLGKVRGLATDFGVEMRTLDAPDFLRAFLARLAGDSEDVCRSLVDASKRLFPMGLRISGWSHSWGNIMKSIAKSNPNWPTILAAARDLCAFFRNEGWRLHLRSLLEGGALDLSPCLLHGKFREMEVRNACHSIRAAQVL